MKECSGREQDHSAEAIAGPGPPTPARTPSEPSPRRSSSPLTALPDSRIHAFSMRAVRSQTAPSLTLSVLAKLQVALSTELTSAAAPQTVLQAAIVKDPAIIASVVILRSILTLL